MRREVKAKLVEHFGGACTLCGYNKSVAAMDFHHVGQKDFEISRTGTFEKLLKEAQKCKLVCSNCHRELHEIERET
jgi:predicted HNH restriction endonuclease